MKRKILSFLALCAVVTAGADKTSAQVDNATVSTEKPTIRPQYLCQSLLAEMPAEKAGALNDLSQDPWPLVMNELASGSAKLLAAPSVIVPSGFRCLSQGKSGKLEVELNATDPAYCDVVIGEFRSGAFTYKTPDGPSARYLINKGAVLQIFDLPDDPAKKVALIFRILNPTPLRQPGNSPP